MIDMSEEIIIKTIYNIWDIIILIIMIIIVLLTLDIRRRMRKTDEKIASLLEEFAKDNETDEPKPES